MDFVVAAKDESKIVGLDSKEEDGFRMSLPLELTWNVLLFLSSASLASLRSTCRASRDDWCAGTGWDLAWWRPRFCRTFLGTLLAMSGGSGGEDFACDSWEQLYKRLDDIRAVRWKECTSESDKDRLVQTRSVPYKFVVDERGSRILRIGGKASFQRREPQPFSQEKAKPHKPIARPHPSLRSSSRAWHSTSSGCPSSILHL